MSNKKLNKELISKYKFKIMPKIKGKAMRTKGVLLKFILSNNSYFSCQRKRKSSK